MENTSTPKSFLTNKEQKFLIILFLLTGLSSIYDYYLVYTHHSFSVAPGWNYVMVPSEFLDITFVAAVFGSIGVGFLAFKFLLLGIKKVRKG